MMHCAFCMCLLHLLPVQFPDPSKVGCSFVSWSFTMAKHIWKAGKLYMLLFFKIARSSTPTADRHHSIEPGFHTTCVICGCIYGRICAVCREITLTCLAVQYCTVFSIDRRWSLHDSYHVSDQNRRVGCSTDRSKQSLRVDVGVLIGVRPVFLTTWVGFLW